MTGFGKASLQLPTKKITVEIKSLNSKGLDLNMRMPSVYREMELALRQQLAQQLERGKVDFSLFVEVTGEETTTKINQPIVKAYMQQLALVAPQASAAELLQMALRMPDTVKVEREEINETEWQEIQKIIDLAVKNLQQFRASEGASLENDFVERIATIRHLMQQTLALDSERISNIKERLQNNIAELQLQIDQNRFEQELIYYLEKLDITEEKTRLTNHLDYFLETINGKEANGRKLGFIAQEMGREINTMGSKSNHSGMQKWVVQMKDELEKIKEQVLNVL